LIVRKLIVFVGCALLGACGNPLRSDTPTRQVYLLRAAAPANAAKDTLPATLQIARPLMAPGLEGDQITLLRSDRRLDFFAAGRWPAELSQTVEALAVDSLRATRQWATVHDSRSLFPADYLLQISVRRFEADYVASPGSPQIEVAFDCALGSRSQRELIANFSVAGSARSEANRLSAIVAAFEQASNQALAEIASQAAAAVRRSQALAPR
jgi:cholesterol transport system auxiliary component